MEIENGILEEEMENTSMEGMGNASEKCFGSERFGTSRGVYLLNPYRDGSGLCIRCWLLGSCQILWFWQHVMEEQKKSPRTAVSIFSVYASHLDTSEV